MIVLKDGKPFKGDDTMGAAQLNYIARLGIWGEKEWKDRGLALATPFDCPAGYDVVGEPRYSQDKSGVWHEECDVVKLAEPVELTPEEQFVLKTGVTIAQLKEMLK